MAFRFAILSVLILTLGCKEEPDTTPTPLKIGEIVQLKGGKVYGTATGFKDGNVEVTWVNRTSMFQQDTLNRDWFPIEALERRLPDKRPITVPKGNDGAGSQSR